MRIGWLAAGLFLFLTIGPANAHRVHEAVTEIRFNERTSEVEIVHRLFAHDLEFAMVEAGMSEDTVPGSSEWNAAADDFLSAAFSFGMNGEIREPDFVGLELEGRFVWAYYVVPAQEAYSEVAVDNRLMMSSFEDQANLTNVFFGETVRTASQTPQNADWAILTP
ncbi:DUF6702 family protein [Hyphobacterium sp. HN65]|uniref:DUF6702 family protein n=1 Tax=Hyphobacterium lacteum TaxID=3116575 RepID=A0ABU7LTH1_9PROT|nr:DUF6702 family protein [Hyphobacterium sp. HN65]MEE2527188.1 DUF6702 family protein [Hyphobacterium sp. HN65]